MNIERIILGRFGHLDVCWPNQPMIHTYSLNTQYSLFHDKCSGNIRIKQSQIATSPEVTDRVPEIGFSGTLNQPKNEFYKAKLMIFQSVRCLRRAPL